MGSIVHLKKFLFYLFIFNIYNLQFCPESASRKLHAIRQ